MLNKILLLAYVTVNNCAWNYIISLNEKILYISRKTNTNIEYEYLYFKTYIH